LDENPKDSCRKIAITLIDLSLGKIRISGPRLASFCQSVHRFMQAKRGAEAAAEFQKMVDHRGIAPTAPEHSLAKLGLGRAYVMTADTAKARAAYQDFFALWKDADPDITILKEARAEYGTLK
jgi:hypothetical protein